MSGTSVMRHLACGRPFSECDCPIGGEVITAVAAVRGQCSVCCACPAAPKAFAVVEPEPVCVLCARERPAILPSPGPYRRIVAAMRACKRFTLARDGESGKIEDAWNYDGTDHGVVYNFGSGWHLDPESSLLSPVGALLINEDPPAHDDNEVAPDPDFAAAHLLNTRVAWVVGVCEGFARRPTSYAAMVGTMSEDLYLDGMEAGMKLRAEFCG